MRMSKFYGIFMWAIFQFHISYTLSHTRTRRAMKLFEFQGYSINWRLNEIKSCDKYMSCIVCVGCQKEFLVTFCLAKPKLWSKKDNLKSLQPNYHQKRVLFSMFWIRISRNVIQREFDCMAYSMLLIVYLF